MRRRLKREPGLSHAAVQITMVIAAAGALWLLVSVVNRARTAGDLDASAVFTLGVAWLVSLPSAVVAFSGSETLAPDVFGNLVKTYPASYTLVTHVSLAFLGVLASALLLRRLAAKKVPVHAAALFAIALWGIAAIGGALHGDSPPSVRAVLLLLCLLAATVLPRGRGACFGAGLFGVTLAIASGVLAALRYTVAFVVPCQGACSSLGFQGVLPNENLLGVALAASIPFAYLGFRGRARTWLCIYLAGMVAATGSVTSTVAAVVTVVALLVLRPRLDADGRAPQAIAGLMLAGAVLLSAAIVLHGWAPSALSNRGELWSVAFHYISRSPLIGYGPDSWSRLYLSGQIPLSGSPSAHNLWLDVLFAAGWIGAILFVTMAVVMLRTAGRARPAVTITLATMAIIGTAEGTWLIGTLDSMSFSLIAIILTGATRQPVAPRSALEHRSARRRRPSRAYEPSSVASAAVPGG